MDHGGVAMVIARINRGGFSAYDEPEQTLQVGLSLDRLSDIFPHFQDKGDLTISLDGPTFSVSDGSLTYRTQTLNLSTLKNPPKRRDISLPGDVTVLGETFFTAVKNARRIAENARLLSDPESDTFTVQAADKVNLMSVKVDGAIVSGERFNALYSTVHLGDFSKAARAADEVFISCQTDSPFRMRYSIGDLAVEFILAPRIEEPEEVE